MPSPKRRTLYVLALAALVLAACAPAATLTEAGPTPTVQHNLVPGYPVFVQYVLDCRTAELAAAGAPIEPGPGCDSWQTNRYERPFNAETQDEYYPDLDILYAELGKSGPWFYGRLALENEQQGGGGLGGPYGFEFDTDLDGRGELLILITPTIVKDEWGVEGVQVWQDENNDVGDDTPRQPDPPPYEGDGYEHLAFNQGSGADPDLAWARAFPGEPSFVEIAFKTTLLPPDPVKWWTWSDQGVGQPASYDYHDAFDNPEAGDAYEAAQYFPSQALFAMDNTCTALWGAPPDEEDPDLCLNDPSVPPPPPPTEPPGGDCPPLGMHQWAQQNYPNQELPLSLLEELYLDYLEQAGCPPTITPTPDTTPPGDCEPLSFDEWKDWFYSQNPQLYPSPTTFLLTEYGGYLAHLAALCTPTEVPCPPMDFETWKQWYYQQNPEMFPSPTSFLLVEYGAYLEDPICPETPTPTPTSFTGTPEASATPTPTPTGTFIFIPSPTPTRFTRTPVISTPTATKRYTSTPVCGVPGVPPCETPTQECRDPFTGALCTPTETTRQ